jgi:hypothetical protein
MSSGIDKRSLADNLRVHTSISVAQSGSDARSRKRTAGESIPSLALGNKMPRRPYIPRRRPLTRRITKQRGKLI